MFINFLSTFFNCFLHLFEIFPILKIPYCTNAYTSKKAPCGRAYAWQVRWVLLWIFWLSLDLKYDAHSWQAPQTFSPPLFPSISFGDIAPVLESIHRSTLGHRCLVLRHNSLPFLLKVCPVLFPFLSTSFSPTSSFLPFPPFLCTLPFFFGPSLLLV